MEIGEGEEGEVKGGREGRGEGRVRGEGKRAGERNDSPAAMSSSAIISVKICSTGVKCTLVYHNIIYVQCMCIPIYTQCTCMYM